jgi:hypothetical protein
VGSTCFSPVESIEVDTTFISVNQTTAQGNQIIKVTATGSVGTGVDSGKTYRVNFGFGTVIVNGDDPGTGGLTRSTTGSLSSTRRPTPRWWPGSSRTSGSSKAFRRLPTSSMSSSVWAVASNPGPARPPYEAGRRVSTTFIGTRQADRRSRRTPGRLAGCQALAPSDY